ncbi:hypothetical protein [Nocardioides sp. P86]|uniref:hypothetical protein n=1 Tax=Nocardioides sp. P86 TaxID=2939569 RepID=UPI00203C333A|nr:hypothetical protein [Nocardioides sp. P86]MCM3513819.1 hypothetical protein [Nocardioides sp. P86]
MLQTPPAVAVRLRRLWAGEIVTSSELAASELGDAWQELDLERMDSSLLVVGPRVHRDVLRGPLGELLARRAREVTAGAITTVGWRTSSRFTAKRRHRTSDVDVFDVQDPLLDMYPSILGDLRTVIPVGTSPEVRCALGSLRMVGASRHRLWFAACTAADRDALRTVPGARAALFDTVVTYQGAKRPLHHQLVDPSYRAKHQLLVP